MPLAHLPKTIRPEPVDRVKTSGENLKFRDFLSVALVINEEDAFLTIGYIFMSPM